LSLENVLFQWESLTMNSTEVREKRQVTLPAEVFEPAGIEVGDRLEWSFEAGKLIGRKLVAAEPSEPFPPGSLADYFTPAKDREELALLKGCVLGPSA
jgi:hypothetical protein